MRILLTNDDGVMAEGIRVLAKELQKSHMVLNVNAPYTTIEEVTDWLK